jgi:drug/metabolite transporter (DMT)-like permease
MTFRITRARATLFIFLSSLIWGSTFVAQKAAGVHMGAFTYNGIRFALGTLTLLPFILWLEKRDPGKTRRTWLSGIAAGFVVFAAINFQQLGIILSRSPTSASEAGFITGLYTIFVPIFGLCIGRKTNRFTWLSAVLAFTGLALLSIGPGGLSSIQLSDSLYVFGAVFWAVHILLIDRYAKNIHPLRFTAIQFLVCSILSTACAFGFETVELEAIQNGIVPILFGGILASGVAYTLQILGQRKVEPTKAAIIFSLESLFAAIAASILISELMTPQKYLGGMIIFAGILLSQMPMKQITAKTDKNERKKSR